MIPYQNLPSLGGREAVKKLPKAARLGRGIGKVLQRYVF
jgi:hypothetical protein